jgi:hypothetical protein
MDGFLTELADAARAHTPAARPINIERRDRVNDLMTAVCDRGVGKIVRATFSAAG